MAIFTQDAARQFAGRIGTGFGAREMERQYFKAVMTVTYRAKLTGRQHTRRVDIGLVRGDEDFDALAHLNIGIRGTVISHSVERVAA